MVRELLSYQIVEIIDTYRDESSFVVKVSFSIQVGKYLYVIFVFIGLICSIGILSIRNYLLQLNLF